MPRLTFVLVFAPCVALLSSTPAVRTIPYADAQPVIGSLRQELLPEELRSKTSGEVQAIWPEWVARHDRLTRARIHRGDRDSVVNFLLFGTTFTRAPRASAADLASITTRPREGLGLFSRRIDDLVSGIASPGGNERLQFARRLVTQIGIDPETQDGRAATRAYLADSLLAAPAEVSASLSAVDAARAQGQATAEWMERTQFRERGLSSDTSIFIDFALDQALTDLRAAGQIAPGGVRRLAIVGPGLDFTDKHDGYDFYPQQTIQPFALMDSLLRLGLANRGAFRLTTFDINARITEHLEGARQRAREGGAYPLALPRNMDAPWNRPLAVYWESLGAGIADRASDLPAPPNAGNVRVRSLRVQPDVVMSILPMTLNIVLERLEGQTAEEQFDLIVATDVLVYYGVFEQSLALTNLAAMLKPGGILLSNTRMFLLPSIAMAEVGTTDVTYMPIPGRGDLRDRVYWYQRR